MTCCRGVAAFEKDLADKNMHIDYEALTALYDDPTNLEAIKDARLRMRARACINQVESQIVNVVYVGTFIW